MQGGEFMRLYKLLENKDKFINKNLNLNDEQKKEIKDTLKRYSYLESTVDWNKSDKFTYEDFKSMILDRVKTSKTSQKKQKRSMAGLTEGEDYLCLYDGEGHMKGGGREIIYIPLTWKASMILSSNHVEPKTWPDSKIMPASDFVGGDVKVEIDPNTKEKKVWMPGAKWCIADPKTRIHWDNYMDRDSEFLFWFRIPKDKDTLLAKDDKNQKIAIEFRGGTSEVRTWQLGDDGRLPNPMVPQRILDIWDEHKDEIHEAYKKARALDIDEPEPKKVEGKVTFEDDEDFDI